MLIKVFISHLLSECSDCATLIDARRDVLTIMSFEWLFLSIAWCKSYGDRSLKPRWRHQMETFSELLALCAGNSPITGEFPLQRPVTKSLDIFFDLRRNKRLSKRSRRWLFEMPSRSLLRHCNGYNVNALTVLSEEIFIGTVPWAILITYSIWYLGRG